MSPRLGFWAAGLLLGLGLAAVIPSGVARLIAFGAAWLAVGWLGEWLFRTPPDPPAKPAAVPRIVLDAGGRRIRPCPGIVQTPDANDPRHTRFVALDPEFSAPEPIAAPKGLIPRLEGRIVFASLFIGRDGAGWSDTAIRQAHRALDRSVNWLEREARPWRAAVQFQLAGVDFVAEDPITEDVEVEFVAEGDHGAPFERLATEHALASASRAASVLGFADIADLVQRIEPRFGVEHVVWLVFLLRAGRSMAIAADDTPIPGVTIALCYAREESLPEPLRHPPFVDPLTIVHESLHLFGATDKYLEPLSRFPPGAVSERDIMYLDGRSLSRTRIDPLTAREIGWTTT